MRVSYRRKRQGRTDYNKRLKLLVSRKTRIVIRKSLKNTVVQFVNYNPKGDVIVASASSRQLIKLGWDLSRNNLPAAYLTGLLAGKKAVEKGVKEGIVDIGLEESVKGCKLYAAVKGIIDAGVKVNCSTEIMPSDDRIAGKHISNYKTDSKIESVFNDIKKKVLG